MCGIAGHLSLAGADRLIADRQVATLAHRGPDSAGVFVSGPAAVGQTRLAVIDLITGDPPITADGDRIGVSLNGEIYNYRDLRKQLIEDGHQLHTQGDTEVIAHLAESLDPTALAQALHGMFGFAVWDARRSRLVLGRDRLGKKPLYYWYDGSTFVFGSEIKAVTAHPAVPSRLAPDTLATYLGFGYVPTPRTFYDGILSVPPGHVLVIEPGGTPEVRPYWSPRIPGLGGTTQLDVDYPEAVRLVRSGVEQAVRRRLISDVPLGAFLSGGVDSSAVVAFMAQHSSSPVRTFTIGFEDQTGFDERPYAKRLAEHVGAEHTEFVVEPNAVELVERLVWHHDQPFGDSSAIPTFLLSELTREHVTVAMCGDGGDELFAGYERFAAGTAALRLQLLPPSVRRLAARTAVRAATLNPRAGKVARFLGAATKQQPDAYRHWVSYIADDDVDLLMPGAAAWGRDDYRMRWERSRGARPLDRFLLLNLETYLLDDLLPKVDRMSMAHGLEVRAPFLDHELVDMALRLPPSTKMRGLTLKRCLKDAVRDLLPVGALDRPKRGFGVPLDRWFREDLAGYVTGTLGSRDASVRRHVDSGALDRLLAQHAAGDRALGHAVWTLLTLEMFLRRQDW